MWAYGLVLYEMIALSPPHVNDCETMSDVMKEIMADETFDENEDPNSSMDVSYASELDTTIKGPGKKKNSSLLGFMNYFLLIKYMSQARDHFCQPTF